MESIKVIEVFPKASDNWLNNPPIASKVTSVGYCFVSNENTVPFDTLQVRDYLIDFEDTSSEIDFITQTRVNIGSDKSELKGIGGVTNLKDFKFSIIRNLVTLKSFMGCEVKVWDYFPSTNTKKIVMVSQIDDCTADKKRVVFTAKGKFSLNEAQLSADSFFGKTKFIKLTKRKDDFGNTRLVFNEKKYSIRSLYVRDQKGEFTVPGESPEYFPVSTNYNIVGDEIIFKGLTPSDLRVKTVGTKRITIEDMGYIIVAFDSSSVQNNPPAILTNNKHTYSLFQEKSIISGRTFAIYRGSPYGCYETVISNILEGGSLFGDGVSLGVNTFFVVQQPRVPLSLMYWFNTDPNIPDPAFSDFVDNWELLLDQSDIPFSQIRTIPVSRQQVKIRVAGVDYQIEKVSIEKDSAGVFSTVLSTTINFPNSLVGELVDVYHQDSTQEFVDLVIEAPFVGVQNFMNMERVTRTIDQFVTRKNWSGTDVAHTHGVMSVMFNIPDLTGDVREPMLFSNFGLDIRYNPSPTFQGSGLGYVYFSIDNHLQYSEKSAVPFNTESTYLFDLPYLTGSQITSTGMQVEAFKTVNQLKPVWSHRDVDRPVTLSDWKETTISFNVEGVIPLTESNSDRTFKLTFNETSLSFILELSVDGNDFYAEVDDLSHQLDSTNPTHTILLNGQGRRRMSLIGGSLYVVSEHPVTGWIIQKIVNGFLVRESGLIPGEDCRLVETRTKEVGVLFGTSYYKLDLLTCTIDKSKPSYSSVCVDIVDRDGILQDDFYIYKLSGNSVLIYKKFGFNDPANPVTLIYNLLTVGAGFEESVFNKPLWEQVAKNRNGEKHFYHTTSDVSAIQAVSTVLKECGLILYENENGFLEVIDLTPPQEDSITKTIGSTNLWIGGDSFSFNEQYLPLSYLVSSLDLYYGEDSLIRSDFIPNQIPFVVAREYLGTKKKEYKLKFETTEDYNTIIKNSELNMLFHAVPVRLCSFQIVDIDVSVGEWVKIQSPLIEGSTGNLYIILKKGSQGFITEVTAFEFDIDSVTRNIQEVPYNEEDVIYIEGMNFNTSMQEVLE